VDSQLSAHGINTLDLSGGFCTCGPDTRYAAKLDVLAHRLTLLVQGKVGCISYQANLSVCTDSSSGLRPPTSNRLRANKLLIYKDFL